MDIYAPYIKGFREKGMVCFLNASEGIGQIRNQNSLRR